MSAPLKIEASPPPSAPSERPGLQAVISKVMLHPSPWRLLGILIASILVAEVGEVALMKMLPPLSGSVAWIVDSMTMLVILSPVYLFLYRPLREHWQERLRMEVCLKKSEEQLTLAMEGANDGLWDWSIRSGELYCSPRFSSMLGYDPGEVGRSFRSWYRLIHPEDRPRFRKALQAHFTGQTPNFAVEYRLRSKSAEWLWVLVRGQVVSYDAQGRPLRAAGTQADISARKQAEMEIRHLSRQLIHTAEEERKRLASDLHDEFGQLLVTQQFGLEMLKDALGTDQQELQAQANRLLSLNERLVEQIRDVSWSLRPSVLDDMGLVSALRWSTEQYATQWPGVSLDFHAEDFAGRLPAEAEVALYRICQECLNNIARHASAREVRVRLRGGPESTSLSIEDDGVGFHVAAQQLGEARHRGIGLLGMKERVAALDGHFKITSRPGCGTTVAVELPVTQEIEV